MTEDIVTLGTIKGGALEELFAAELSRVLANIADINTDPKAKRSISIDIAFKPNKERDEVEVILKCSSKVAGISPVGTRLFVGLQHGEMVAVEQNTKQAGLFDEPKKTTLAAVATGTFGGNHDGGAQ